MWVNAALAILLLPALLLQEGIAGPLPDPESLPHVDRRGRSAFVEYRHADDHRAFAIAPGGAWGWVSDQASPAEAADAAIDACQSATQQRCLIYADNDQIVLDRADWENSWKNLRSTWNKTPGTGSHPGEQFYDLTFKDLDGNIHNVTDYRGDLLILHFWASWCPPCMRELPLLHRFSQQLAKSPDDRINIVLLQVREPVSDAHRWLKANQLDALPLFDSGSRGEDESTFALADGETIADRMIAARFPTSYFIDQQGRVLLRHTGPIDRWDEYLPLLKTVAGP